MKWRILTIGETEVYLHPATALCILYGVIAGSWQMMLTAYVSVFMHECAHAAAAVLLGQSPREIELSPLGAIMRLDDEERLARGRRLLMLFAGPAMSLLLCISAYLLTLNGWIGIAAGRRIFLSNLTILVVNLLPVLPLDGGRMLSVLLGLIMNPAGVSKCMRALGRIAGLMLAGAGVWQAWHDGICNFSLIMLGCFVIYASAVSTTTQAMSELRCFLERKIHLERKGSVSCRWVAALSSCPLRDMVKRLPPGSVCMIRVLECGTMCPAGDIDEYRLVEEYLKNPQGTLHEALINT